MKRWNLGWCALYAINRRHFTFCWNPITSTIRIVNIRPSTDHLMTISDREKVERSDASTPFESRTAVPFVRLRGFNRRRIILKFVVEKFLNSIRIIFFSCQILRFNATIDRALKYFTLNLNKNFLSSRKLGKRFWKLSVEAFFKKLPSILLMQQKLEKRGRKRKEKR